MQCCYFHSGQYEMQNSIIVRLFFTRELVELCCFVVLVVVVRIDVSQILRLFSEFNPAPSITS
jgi:hypothetical protein